MVESTKYTPAEALDIISQQAQEIERLRAAGDALIEVVSYIVDRLGPGVCPASVAGAVERGIQATQRWRSAAGAPTEGRAPTADTAAQDAIAQTIANMTALIEWTECEGDETGEFFRHDGYVLMVDDLRRAVRALRVGDTATPRSVAELPATLRTVDDTAAVCQAAGLPPGDMLWQDGQVSVVADAGYDPHTYDTSLATVHVRRADEVDVAVLHPSVPPSLLLAAIEAARGGAR